MTRYDLAVVSRGDTKELHLRASLKYAEELHRLLEAHDIKVSPVVFASGGPPEFVCVLSASAGLVGALAAGLRVFFHRHSDKEFRVRMGDHETTVKGCSEQEAARLLAWVVEQAQGSRNVNDES
jgi:hypothetical protein